MFQKKYLIPFGLAALGATVWTAGWFWLADRITTSLDRYAADRRAERIELGWDAVRVTGFPLRFEAAFANPRGVWTAPQRTVGWQGPDMVMRFLVDRPRVLSFQAPGNHRVRLAVADQEMLFELANGTMDGRIELSENGLTKRLKMISQDVRVSVDSAPRVSIAESRLDWMRLSGADRPEEITPVGNGHRLSLELLGLDIEPSALEAAVRHTLGTSPTHLAMRTTLNGDLSPLSTDRDTLLRWRNAGGTVDLDDVALEWGPVSLYGDGTLALDANLQPVVAFSARIVGLDRLIDVLERAGQVRPREAAIARIALAVLTRAPAGGGPPEARVPVTVQDGRLSIGPVPLMQVPEIAWN